jgi:hypothetical protein
LAVAAPPGKRLPVGDVMVELVLAVDMEILLSLEPTHWRLSRRINAESWS